MSRLLSIEDQVLPKRNFYLTYHGESHTYGYKGLFYKVAESSALDIFQDDLSTSFLANIHRSFVPQGKNKKIYLQEYNPAADEYGKVTSLVTDEDKEKAKQLFFKGAPAQAWLLMVSGLVKPKELGISVVDTQIALLAQHKEVIKSTT